MDSGQLALYPLALLKLLGEEASAENLPLGTATRAGRESSRFRAPAHRVLEALINHSPSPDTIAGEFLVQLGKCGISVVESLGAMFRSSTSADLADHVSKLKQCVAVFAPILQVTGQ